MGGARGGGKLSPLDSKVLTPKGFVLMGDIAVGDSVIDPTTGGSCSVIGVYPQGLKRIWRLVFDDGAALEVGDEHLWLYRLANSHRPRTKASTQREMAAETLGAGSPQNRWDFYRVGTTAEILALHAAGRSIRIPLMEPALFTVNGRTGTGDIDPYLIGLMLGDGAHGSITMTSCDDEIRDYLLSQGFRPHAPLHSDGKPKQFALVGPRRQVFDQWLRNKGLRYCRSWEKFIPDSILTASIDYRLAVLQGLMDTDGTIDERGRVYFISTSARLAEGVQWLARSLGGKARIRQRQTSYSYKGEKKDGRPSWQVRVWHPRLSAFFRLSRKRGRATDSWNGGAEITRELVAIEEVGEKEAQCIKVSSPYSLYVADDFIVTRNTDGVLGKWALKDRRYGKSFNAIMFRKTTVSSEDAIDRSKKIYEPLGGKFNEQKLRWRMPNGGRVAFAYLDSIQDADEYQGRNLTDAWVEEAGQYPAPDPLDRLFATLRSAEGVPVQMILTGNPGGAGQHWLADRYKLIPFPAMPKIVEIERASGVRTKAAVIPSRITDNIVLLDADPGYVDRLRMTGSAALVKAWLEGDWSAIEGAFFDCWSARNVVAPFAVPKDWLRFRSFDWGSAAPFSVGWWCVCGDDTPIRTLDRSGRDNLEVRGTVPRGALIRYREWYGASSANKGLKLTTEEVAAGIIARDQGETFSYSVADPAIFAEDGGPSRAEIFARSKIYFNPADNKRVSGNGAMGGWDEMRQRIKGQDGVPMLYAFDSCRDFIRTIPALPHDPKRAEDVDCWVAGTMIAVPGGERPIEEVKAGDIVQTPLGPRAVTKSYVSGPSETVAVKLSDGRTLRGTPHHKIHVEGRGLIALADLSCQLVLTERITWSRLFNIAVGLIVAMRAASTIIRAAVGRLCTSRNGWMMGGEFLPATISTTRMMTTTTTNYPTSNASLRRSMEDTTPRSASPNYNKRSLFGGLQMKARPRSATMLERCSNELRFGHVRADIVALLSILDILRKYSALPRAWWPKAVRCISLAKSAGHHSERSATPKSRCGPVHIVAVGRCAERTPVFNLTVEGAHLFYANGILSSNTDAEDHAADEGRYACMSRPWVPRKPEKEKPKGDGSGYSAREADDYSLKVL